MSFGISEGKENGNAYRYGRDSVLHENNMPAAANRICQPSSESGEERYGDRPSVRKQVCRQPLHVAEDLFHGSLMPVLFRGVRAQFDYADMLLRKSPLKRRSSL